MLFGDFMDIGAEDRKYIEINDRDEVDFYSPSFIVTLVSEYQVLTHTNRI